jgi:hypothetical protein
LKRGKEIEIFSKQLFWWYKDKNQNRVLYGTQNRGIVDSAPHPHCYLPSYACEGKKILSVIFKKYDDVLG